MKNKATMTLRPITVQSNTDNKKKHQWARIVCAKTGQILHTGQLGYIRSVARKRYNKKVNL